MRKIRQNKTCAICRNVFSCPQKSDTAYSISLATWEKRVACSRVCATEFAKPKISAAHKGKCAAATLAFLRNMAQEKKGKKRIPFSDEWKKNLSLAHIGKTSPRKGKKSSISGELHWNWKGGKSSQRKVLGNSFEWKGWREAVFARDNYTCLDCGAKGYVEAHHIIPVRLSKDKLFDTTNGITLCRPCHLKTFARELELSGVYFTLAVRAA